MRSAFGVDHGDISKAQADWGDMNSSEKKKLVGGTGAALAAIAPTVAGPPIAMRGHREAKIADGWARSYSDDAWSTIRRGFRPDTTVRATRTDGVGGRKELPAGSRKTTSSKGPVGVNIPESAKHAFRNAHREAKWARRARNIRNAGIAATVGGGAVYVGGLKATQDAQRSANKRINARLKAKKISKGIPSAFGKPGREAGRHIAPPAADKALNRALSVKEAKVMRRAEEVYDAPLKRQLRHTLQPKKDPRGAYIAARAARNGVGRAYDEHALETAVPLGRGLKRVERQAFDRLSRKQSKQRRYLP